MGYAEIDFKHLKMAVNAVLDHLIEDLGMEKVAIEEQEDSPSLRPPEARTAEQCHLIDHAHPLEAARNWQ